MNLNNKVEEVVSPAYLVGGAVRDILLGKEPKDHDFATPLTPDEIEQAVRNTGRKPYLIGKRFGTVGFKLDGEMVEVTTFRAEKYEDGNRKPTVEFVNDITADLSRRDFTINAMAMRGTRLIDPFGGAKNLQNQIIKAVGLPSHRFREDPLRMLRAARFVSQLKFQVEEKTFDQAAKLSYKILDVSRERWMIELDKILLGQYPRGGLAFLMETRLLNYMIPELALQRGYDQNNPHHARWLWNHTIGVVEGVPEDINLRWAALLHDMAKPFTRTDKKDWSNYIHHERLGAEMVERLARHLKWSNDRREAVVELVLNHMSPGSPLKAADNAAKKPLTEEEVNSLLSPDDLFFGRPHWRG